MKRMIIGQSGAGKSTLARKMQTITHSPLLPLTCYGIPQITVTRLQMVQSRTKKIHGWN